MFESFPGHACKFASSVARKLQKFMFFSFQSLAAFHTARILAGMQTITALTVTRTLAHTNKSAIDQIHHQRPRKVHKSCIETYQLSTLDFYYFRNLVIGKRQQIFIRLGSIACLMCLLIITDH